jgi:hypothetical protein
VRVTPVFVPLFFFARTDLFAFFEMLANRLTPSFAVLRRLLPQRAQM